MYIPNIPNFQINNKLNIAFKAQNKSKEKTNPILDDSPRPITKLQPGYLERVLAEQKARENIKKTTLNQAVIDFSVFSEQEGKVSKENFGLILKNNPEIIEKAKNFTALHYTGKATAEEIVKTSIAIKNYLDEKYDSNYRIISLGTSPYPISQTLEYLGKDVIYVPISTLSQFSKYFDNYKDFPNLVASLSYLKKQIKSKEGNAQTKNIILDYAYSGATFENIEYLIQEAKVAPKRSIRKEPLNELMQIALAKSKTENRQTIFAHLSYDMENSEIGNLSNVPHFSIMQTYDNEKESPYSKNYRTQIFNGFETYSTPLARAFSLDILDELYKTKLNDFLNKKGKVTKEEYEKIKKDDPILIEYAKKYVKENYTGKVEAKEMALMAKLVKKNLDNYYSGNYQIISLGTSPYPLTQAMEYLGSEVTYLPISRMNWFLESLYKFEEFPNFEKLAKFLEKKMTKTEDPNKTFLLIDYASSGKTLKIMKKFLRSLELCNPQNIEALSILPLIEDSFYKEYTDENEVKKHFKTSTISNLNKDMENAIIGDLSNVKHFPYDEESMLTQEELTEEFENFSKPLARAFNLCLLDNLNN